MDLGLTGRGLRLAALPVFAALTTACGDSASTIVSVNGVAVGLTIVVADERGGPMEPSASTSTLALAVGDSASVGAIATNAVGLPIGGVVVTWSSSDAAVADVSTAGVVTAVGVGSAEVLAGYGDLSASMPVTVAEPAAAIE